MIHDKSRATLVELQNEMAQKGLPVFSDGSTPGENDIVIALMGMTGSGKSSIISLCTNQDIKIGHELVSCTQDVETYVFRRPTLRFGRVYLVDTPGFDDTNRKDTEILRTLDTDARVCNQKYPTFQVFMWRRCIKQGRISNHNVGY